MKSIVQTVIFASVLVNLAALSAWALGDKEAQDDFIIQQQNLLDRYEDYYTRLVMKERENAKRERGAEAMHNERVKKKAEMEKVRREYKRPQSEDTRAAEIAYEKEKKEKQKEHDRDRAEYVRQRQKLEKMESGIARIPENQELGIMSDDETL